MVHGVFTLFEQESLVAYYVYEVRPFSYLLALNSFIFSASYLLENEKWKKMYFYNTFYKSYCKHVPVKLWNNIQLTVEIEIK